MGGIVCAIPRQAILRFHSVPTARRDEKEFDEQIRDLYANPTIANAVATETQRAKDVCDILGKESFSDADRVVLLEVVESLYYVHPT